MQAPDPPKRWSGPSFLTYVHKLPEPTGQSVQCFCTSLGGEPELSSDSQRGPFTPLNHQSVIWSKFSFLSMGKLRPEGCVCVSCLRSPSKVVAEQCHHQPPAFVVSRAKWPLRFRSHPSTPCPQRRQSSPARWEGRGRRRSRLTSKDQSCRAGISYPLSATPSSSQAEPWCLAGSLEWPLSPPFTTPRETQLRPHRTSRWSLGTWG